MRFKMDDNLPEEVATELLFHQHDATTVKNQGLAGKDDSVTAERVREKARCLITLDLDFSDLRVYPPADYSGIIVVRSKQQDNRADLSMKVESKASNSSC